MLQYLKYPVTPHWTHRLVALGEDEHGRWFGAASGSYSKPDRTVEITIPFVQLVPADRWWTALHNGPDHEIETYVDMCTPVCWTDAGRAETIDLDLDVIRDQAGVVTLVDQDEFATHQAELAYPAELIDGARRSAIEVLALIEANAEPFATRQQAWRAHLLGDGPRPV